jgi:hypothetical protein
LGLRYLELALLNLLDYDGWYMDRTGKLLNVSPSYCSQPQLATCDIPAPNRRTGPSDAYESLEAKEATKSPLLASITTLKGTALQSASLPTPPCVGTQVPSNLTTHTG